MFTLTIKFKLLAIVIISMALALPSPKQEVLEKEVALQNGQAVKLDLKFADEINIKTWDKPKLFIKVTVEHDWKEKPDLKLLEFNHQNEVKIEEKISNLKENSRHYYSDDENCNCCKLDIDYEIYLPANVELEINTISGNIEVKNMNNSLSLETISGFVDVSIDASKNYDLNCSTISGSIYSNIEFASNHSVKADIVGSKLNTSLNGGGKKIHLKTISGDLFIRKR